LPGLTIFSVVVLDIVCLTKQVRQQETTHPASTQHPTTEQQPERSSLFGFTLGFVHDPFSFHGFTPIFTELITSMVGFDRRYLRIADPSPQLVQIRRRMWIHAPFWVDILLALLETPAFEE